MTDLLAMLEAATEGSRTLDILVASDVLTKQQVTDFLLEEYTRQSGGKVPHYTTSIDAALTLVPEGTEWILETVPEEGGYGAGVGESMWNSFALTPALAICIAALKARSA
jgi:hypothetical protein